jgi:hypothetical protein
MVFGRCGALLPLFRHVGVRCIAALRRGKCLLRHRSDRPKLEKLCFTIFHQLFAVVQYTEWCVAGSPQDVWHLSGGSAYLTHRNVALPQVGCYSGARLCTLLMADGHERLFKGEIIGN